MRKILLIMLGVLSFVLVSAQSAEWQWMHSIGGIGPGPNNDDQDNINDFRIDREGNAYMAGSFYNRMDIQDIHLEVPPLVTNNRDASNGFVAKFDCAGEVEWVSHWKSANGTGVYNILPLNDVLYVAGALGTTAGYDLSIDDTIVGSGQWTNIKNLLAKYDLEGNLLNYKVFDKRITIALPNGLLQADSEGNLISLASSDSAYIDGVYLERGYHLLKLDSNGNYIDHELLFSNPNNTYLLNKQFNFLELDQSGNVYLGGTLDSAMHTFAGVQPDYGSSSVVTFLAKFDHAFNLQWLEHNENIGPVIGQMCFNVAIDNSLNTYASFRAYNYKEYINQTYRGVIFQGDTVKNTLNSIYSALKFVINKYDEDGDLVWMKQLNSYRSDENSKLDMYVSNDTIVAFGLIGSGAFGIDNYTTNLATPSYMLLMLDTNGTMLDIEFFPIVGGNSQWPYGAFLSSSNNIHIVGIHSDYVEFPDSTLYPRYGSGSNQDIFIAKYGTTTCFRCDSLELAFEVEQDLGYTAQVVSHTTEYGESYLWDFGNGQTSTDSLPSMSIAYPDTGVYTVCLSVENYCDTQTLCQAIHIGCPPPLAQGFTHATGNNSLEILSQDLAQHDSYVWSFGDGQTSTDSLPTHTYNTSGAYDVCLVAMNSCGIDSFCQSIAITCPNPLLMAVELEQDSFYVEASVVNIVNYDSVYWDFGDGNNSTDILASNTYAAEGSYNVCVTAYNACGDSTYCQQVNVVGTGVVALAGGGSIVVYPNPTKDYLQIAVAGGAKHYQLELIDMRGRSVLQDKLSGDTHQLDLSNLSSGMYYLELSNKKEQYRVGVSLVD